MIKNIEIYFAQNSNTPQKFKEENKQIRENKTWEQMKLKTVSYSQVFSYVNGFIEILWKENSFDKTNI